MATRVVIVFDNLPLVAAHLQKAAADLVRTAAFNVEARAKSLAAVDTGAMRAAIYTVTRDSSGYSAAAAEATSASATAAEHLQDEEPRPEKATSAVVHAAMDYSDFVEHGTGHMAAQPFMTPAAAMETPRLQQALRKLATELESGV
jgi:HK97 gp10 family phage protein